MWISIQTKRVNISPRMRRKIEDFIDRLFERERRYVGSVVISIRPTMLGRDVGYAWQSVGSCAFGNWATEDIGATCNSHHWPAGRTSFGELSRPFGI